MAPGESGTTIVRIRHGVECRTGAGHGWLVEVAGVDRSSGTRSGVLMASWAMRRNSSNDMTGISRWPDADDGRRPLLDPDRDDEVGVALLAPDVADERVVELVDLPGAFLLASQIWAVPVLPPTSKPGISVRSR